jgi:hypothetical protein
VIGIASVSLRHLRRNEYRPFDPSTSYLGPFSRTEGPVAIAYCKCGLRHNHRRAPSFGRRPDASLSIGRKAHHHFRTSHRDTLTQAVVYCNSSPTSRILLRSLGGHKKQGAMPNFHCRLANANLRHVAPSEYHRLPVKLIVRWWSPGS